MMRYGISEPKERGMDFQETISSAQEAVTVRRVYGEPYERDGVTVIPAAAVRGGGGAGSGEDPAKGGSGGGGGFGLTARPVGAYVIDGGKVRWEPVVDPTRLAVLAIVGLLGLAFLLRRR
jgi:uncharacterized spore protein YtfJ